LCLQDQKNAYDFLLELYDYVLTKLVDGVKLCDVYQAGVQFVEDKRPEFKGHLVKNFGFATGIEFREGSLVIGPKCSAPARQNMVFSVSIGFSQLTRSADDPTIYALFVGDTVKVQESESALELTGMSKKKLKSIAIFLGEEEEPAPQAPLTEEMFKDRLSSKILDSRTRSEIPAEDKRKVHQLQLAKQMNKQAKERFLEQKGSSGPKKQKPPPPVAYKNVAVFPKEPDIRNLKLCVDRKYESVILPVHGFAAPFHISTIKNISRSEEGAYVYLRMNFFYPGASINRNEETYFPNPDMTFVKEISLRSVSSGPSSAASNFGQAFQAIKEVQKGFKTREAEKREMEGVVEQASLVLNTSRGNPRLKDLYMRPVIGSRRIQGTLEAHTNGFRYTSLKGDKVDILYSNIKHGFFQPSKGEMIVLLHFHLKHPIIIGKKKHKDIQFYAEVGEIMTDLGRSHNMRDRDDFLAEQAERELRAKLDNAFDNFRKKVESLPQSHVTFEIPFKELGFHGVPFRSTVFLQPTTNCLVNLTDQPPFVVTLEEIELIHFERVQFHMKNVDLVVVFKDYKRKVATVNAIPMNNLDSVKDWLNSCDIKYTEGIQSLNWSKIMKTIIDDPEGFFDSGGWSFLDPESDEENQDHVDGSDDEDSEEFQVSEEELASESDSDEDYTDISENSGEEFSEEGSDEESGKDWEELEEEAREADYDHDSDEEDRNRRKRQAPTSKPKAKKHRR
jgi:nucleosome binding factor SPN SPT16 subunit